MLVKTGKGIVDDDHVRSVNQKARQQSAETAQF
jgi:hypothetical protein